MAQTDRHHRQQLLGVIGEHGQGRLRGAHAVVVGCGALGSVSADWLARAGVGRLTLIDRDVVEETNLQRQTLLDERHLGTAERPALPKAEAAKRRIAEIDASIDVEAVAGDVVGEAAAAMLMRGRHGRPDVLLDGTDNFETRFVLNDLSVSEGVPYIYAGAVGTSGMVIPFAGDGLQGGDGPCLRCIFPDLPAPGSQPTCDTAGVLGPAVGVVASWQAAAAIRTIVEGCAPRCVLHEFDPWAGETRQIDLSGARDPGCPCCGDEDFAFLDGRAGAGPVTLCGRGAVQVRPRSGDGVDLALLGERLGAHGSVRSNGLLLRFETAEIEMTVFADGRALVHGIDDHERARSLYAKYVGA